MTKPSNFPYRKNSRRIAAANRLKITNPEFAILQERIVDPFVARGVRTKKIDARRRSFSLR